MSAGPYPTKPMFEALKGRVATLEDQGGELPPIYLSAGGTPSFEPAQRLNHFASGNNRIVGPILPAGTYSKMVVPLRHIQGGEAVSAALVRTSDNMVLHLFEGILTSGQTEWVIEGAWDVDSETAFVVGIRTGDWDSQIVAWYGGEEGYQDYPNVKIWSGYPTLPPQGEIASGEMQQGRQRTVLVYGAKNEKSTQNPLDPADFPVSTVANAPKNSGFMTVDDAAKTASLCWKFSDGTVRGVALATVIQTAAPPLAPVTATTLDRTAGTVMFNFPPGMDIDVTLYDWTVTAGGQSEVLRNVAQAGTLDNRPYYSGETFTMSLAAFGANGIVVTGAPK